MVKNLLHTRGELIAAAIIFLISVVVGLIVGLMVPGHVWTGLGYGALTGLSLVIILIMLGVLF